MLLGKSRDKNRRSIQIKTGESSFLEIEIKTEVRICGITFAEDPEVTYKKNFLDRLEKTKAQLNMWRTRNLTLEGRIIITKSLGISQILYPLQMLAVKDEFLKKTEDAIYKFIWKRRNDDKSPRDKIKRTTLQNGKDYGGLKAPNIKAKGGNAGRI